LKRRTTEVTPEQIDAAINEDQNIMGHIALSCISGYPLMIIGTASKTFVHFSTIQQLMDEHDLSTACTFSGTFT
jgi:hypothetical protein